MGNLFSRETDDDGGGDDSSSPDLPASSALRSRVRRAGAPAMAMVPKSSKEWLTSFDGLDKLTQHDADVPKPKDGEVLVKIHAVSLNFRDTEVCMGLYDHHQSVLGPGMAIVPCSDMCGSVVDASKASASGSKDNEPAFQPGDRVMSIFNQTHLRGDPKEDDLASGLGFPLPGVLTQYRCFSASALVHVPDYLSDQEASCLPIAAVTAWNSLNWMNPIGKHFGSKGYVAATSGKDADKDNDKDKAKAKTVLLQGTGGVSIAGLQIAHAAGLRTIITSKSDDKLKRAKDELGADVTINYRTHWAWEEPVMERTSNVGADIVFETGGANTLRKSFACVAFGGIINCIGYLSGKHGDGSDPGDGGGANPPKLHALNVNVLALRRSVTLKGILNAGKDRFEEMLGFYAANQIRPVVGKVFDFADAPKALQYLYSQEHFGKVVIQVASD